MRNKTLYDKIWDDHVVKELPDGNSLIYIEVPDSLSFKYKPKDDDVFNSCHLTLYSKKTIEHLLYLSNLEIVDCDQYTTLRNYMSIRVLAKLKN